MQSTQGDLELAIPRDRNGDFEPILVPKHQRRLAGLDEKILAMYARGTSTRDISAQLEELYGAKVSASLISEVTDAVSEDAKAWQCRPLDEVYPSLPRCPLRQVIKTKAVFPDEESVFKLMYLAINNIAKRWTRPIKNWRAALSHFAILFPERFTL